MAVAIALGLVGSQTAPSGPSGSSMMIRRRSGKSDEDDGEPDGHRLEELVGRGKSLVGSDGLVGHDADVGGSDPARQLIRRDAIEQVDAPAGRGIGGTLRELVVESTVAKEHEVRVLHVGLEDGIDKLAEPPVRGEDAVVQDDASLGRQSQPLAQQVRRGIGRRPAWRGIVHHDRTRESEVLAEDRLECPVDRHERDGTSRQAALKRPKPEPCEPPLVARAGPIPCRARESHTRRGRVSRSPRRPQPRAP